MEIVFDIVVCVVINCFVVVNSLVGDTVEVVLVLVVLVVVLVVVDVGWVGFSVLDVVVTSVVDLNFVVGSTVFGVVATVVTCVVGDIVISFGVEKADSFVYLTSVTINDSEVEVSSLSQT